MTKQSEILKKRIEEATAKSFLTLYNKERSQKEIKFIRLGLEKNREPDCICTDEIAIELVGAYDNDYQASKQNQERCGRENTFKADYKLNTVDSIEREVAKKIDKLEKGNYSGHKGKIFLVCKLEMPLVESKSVENFVNERVSYREDGYFTKYFDEVWLLWISQRTGEKRIIQVE